MRIFLATLVLALTTVCTARAAEWHHSNDYLIWRTTHVTKDGLFVFMHVDVDAVGGPEVSIWASCGPYPDLQRESWYYAPGWKTEAFYVDCNAQPWTIVKDVEDWLNATGGAPPELRRRLQW